MELAVIISLIALLVALPSCIADSLIVINKVRSYFRNRQRTYNKPLVPSKVLPLLKKASLFHLQKSVAVSCLTVLVITLIALVEMPLQTVQAPSPDVDVKVVPKTLTIPKGTIFLLDPQSKPLEEPFIQRSYSNWCVNPGLKLSHKASGNIISPV